MKTPIEPSDIRAGDLIREEYAEPWFTDGGIPRVATEYTATPELKTICMRKASGHFLLDRPTPPVELPTEPTLGWLTYAGVTIFGEFRKFQAVDSSFTTGMAWEATEIRDGEAHNSYGSVTAFTPATAVPTDALDVLRKYRSDLDWDCATPAVRRIDKFLAAVDEANR